MLKFLSFLQTSLLVALDKYCEDISLVFIIVRDPMRESWLFHQIHDNPKTKLHI